MQRTPSRCTTLQVNRAGGRASPREAVHAACGAGDGRRAGDLAPNRIRFDPALLERYIKFFEAVRDAYDHANPHYPYFHLKTEGFRHLEALPGRGAAFRRIVSENDDYRCAASGWRIIRREMSITSRLALANHTTAAIANPLY